MLKSQLQAQQIAALKAKDALKLGVVRQLLAAITNKEIDKQSELTDDEVLAVIKRARKEAQESIDSFTKGGRADLVAESQAQLTIIESYLPAELSDEELTTAIQTIIQNNGALAKQNPKAIIGVCMKELRSKADGARIMAMIQKLGV